MISNNITVNYVPAGNTGFITVTVEEVPNVLSSSSSSSSSCSQILTSEFHDIDGVQPNSNDTTFTIQQQDIRVLDMMKDGLIKPSIQNDVKSIMSAKPSWNKFNDNMNYSELKTIEDTILEANKHKITKLSWVKINKDSSLLDLLNVNYIFNEVGLSPDYYINNPNYCHNFANEIIDPGNRPPYTSNEVRQDISFPKNNDTLILTQEFLSFFGFSDCSVTATRTDNSKNYNFAITLPGLEQPITANTTTVGEFTVNWFMGNPQKNDFIQTNPDTNIKKGLLITKEMGDILQVLIMLAWTIKNKENDNFTYTMTTLDKVVMIMCIILNLNCIFTGAEKDEDQITKNPIKLRYIEIFKPITDPVQIAMGVFNSTKLNILKENGKFIAAISYLKQNPQVDIHMAGTDPSTFPAAFYAAIETDLEAINSILAAHDLIAHDLIAHNVEEINTQTEKMKENFLFNTFIRKVGTSGAEKLKMMMAKKYTKSNDLWVNFVPSITDYGKLFYLIGKQEYKSQNGGGNGPSIEKVIQTFNFNDDSLNHLEFVYEAMYYDEENPDGYNLYETLDKQINQMGDYIDDVRNELYREFYFNNEVYYDINLTTKIDGIRAEILVDISQLALQTPVSPVGVTAINPLSQLQLRQQRQQQLHQNLPSKQSIKQTLQFGELREPNKSLKTTDTASPTTSSNVKGGSKKTNKKKTNKKKTNKKKTNKKKTKKQKTKKRKTNKKTTRRRR